MNMRDGLASTPRLLDRLVAALERVSNVQLFVFSVLWVVLGGLTLQLIVLPYIAPFAHGGHGLIANLDGIGFHEMARQTADRMRSEGLKDFGRWIDGTYNYPVAITAVLYLVHPEPWIQLPLNGVLFGIVVVAVGRVLGVMAGSRGVGLAGLLPFFLFPSFILIWGQPHRDLISGSGFSLVLYTLVMSAYPQNRKVRLPVLVVLAVCGMAIMWLSRPYALSLTAAGALVFCVLAGIGNGTRRVRLLTVTAAILIAAIANIRSWTETRARIDPGILVAARMQSSGQGAAPPAEPAAAAPAPAAESPAPPAEPGQSPPTTPPAFAAVVDEEVEPWTWRTMRWPRTRRIVRLTESQLTNCLPIPAGGIADTFLYNICNVREGFIAEAQRAGASSGIDYDLRLRSVEDLVAYGPRALAVGLLAPGPARWGTERTVLGRLATSFVPFEMITAYVAFLFALIFGRRQLARASVWAVLAFCVTYIVIYTIATPQLGGLYRMRAFAFATVVSTAVTVTCSRFSAPALRAHRDGAATIC